MNPEAESSGKTRPNSLDVTQNRRRITPLGDVIDVTVTSIAGDRRSEDTWKFQMLEANVRSNGVHRSQQNKPGKFQEILTWNCWMICRNNNPLIWWCILKLQEVVEYLRRWNWTKTQELRWSDLWSAWWLATERARTGKVRRQQLPVRSLQWGI